MKYRISVTRIQKTNLMSPLAHLSSSVGKPYAEDKVKVGQVGVVAVVDAEEPY